MSRKKKSKVKSAPVKGAKVSKTSKKKNPTKAGKPKSEAKLAGVKAGKKLTTKPTINPKPKPATPLKKDKPENVLQNQGIKSYAKGAKKISSKHKDYKFKNFYQSEVQLKDITHHSNPEDILKAYTRLITIHANNHIREGVELEDLISEAKTGLVEVINESKAEEISGRKRSYNFHQACLYRIRQKIFQYCLGNANQIKTPYYIQRGCMHVGQIFKLLGSQTVAEAVLKRPGPATEQEIIAFIYDEDERLPLKPLKFIKSQITKDPNSKEFNQILSGILNHELGSRHSYVKNNITDVARVLHVKEKLWYSATSNNMNYPRVVSLILSARQTKTELTGAVYSPHYNNLEQTIVRRELMDHGSKVCGQRNFEIFVQNKVYDKTYDELAKLYNMKKPQVVEVIKECIKLLRKDESFQEIFKENV